MEWKGRDESKNVEDARSQGPTGGGGRMGGGGGLGLLMTIGKIFGLKGILAALVLGAAAWKMGLVDASLLLGTGSPLTTTQRDISPEEDERFKLVKVVMRGTEEVWRAEFARIGRDYVLPKMTVYRGQVQTGCGGGNAAMGPFYCPADQKVYIDLSFYDELARTFESPGDFAQAYVVAHEVGHHVQQLLGTSAKVAAQQGKPHYNELSVRLELQADFYAGVWANHSQESLRLDASDMEEAMRAANAIGDDAIQQKMQGRVVPHSFTHGTSAQRMRWFKKGLVSGKIEEGDTFTMAYRDL